jgi:hypothetical protein
VKIFGEVAPHQHGLKKHALHSAPFAAAIGRYDFRRNTED